VVNRFYFYDLETSGLDAKWHRIMQCAGQLTNDKFEPIGEPDNWLVRLTPEILPDPEAILITGITPQKTLEEGFSEAEFLKQFTERAFQPNTTVLGFNSLRFDDEFVRNTLYRNFYDPYEREWSNGRSRWDIIDTLRMTRALRPEGIIWPTNAEGEPTNRLEEIARANKLDHYQAHDALSDVMATIDVARLLCSKQPKLFEHLLSLRFKQAVKAELDKCIGKPFVHTSGRFSSAHASTSVVIALGVNPDQPNEVLVYDLRHSPKFFVKLDHKELERLAFTPRQDLGKDEQRLPLKTIHINRSPAIAPLGVLDAASQNRIGLNLKQVSTHMKELSDAPEFQRSCLAVWFSKKFEPSSDIDAQLYNGFINDNDKQRMTQLRAMSPSQISTYQPEFNDDRLSAMFVRYKARNFPQLLSTVEQTEWEKFRMQRLTKPEGSMLSINRFMNRLAELAKAHSKPEEVYLLEELRHYGESIMPFETQELL
jgi:exodeoxyribonuclease-1